MPRLKGKARDYCSIGHRMEKPIAPSFMEDVNQRGFIPGASILSFHSAGLVAKKSAPWAKDSIDFLCTML